MGLDLYMVRAKVGENPWEVADELAYGRKAWEICSFFGAASNDNCYAEVTPALWDRFMSKFKNMDADKIEKAYDAFSIESNLPDDYPEMVFTDDMKRAIAEYELWYNRVWDGNYPYLGYEFSTGYMLSFYNADAEVRRAFDEGDRVYVCASY